MIVGIDLGTTNSAIAVWRDARAELIPNSLGHVLTPSAVSIDAGGALLVGLAARERQSTHPLHTATAFKRYMGSNRLTRVGEREFLAEELSALVLGQLKRDAEAFLGEPVTEAVITVPAYFNDKQRKATRRAGELAGLKVERLLNEPTAAALAYGIDKRADESRFLVFDLGGGTFDVSVLEIFEGVVEVRSSTGDNRLGGEDFNAVLMDEFRDRVSGQVPQRIQQNTVYRERVREAAERARRALSEQGSAIMTVVWDDQRLEAEITGEELAMLSKSLLDRLREPVVRVLRDSDLRTEDMAEIVLVGGATRMPIVRQAVTRMFGRFPAYQVNADEAVALGAAIQAGLKSRDAALRELVLTDVCPFSLGIEAGERGAYGKVRTGLFAPIIERNTVIPASRIQGFSTLQDHQRQIEVNVYQGESRWVRDNIELGKLTVEVPPAPAGEVHVEVRFSYDINGLLEVDVYVPASGEVRQLVIIDDESMSVGELEGRRAALAALKHHPRNTDANRQALERAGRCYEAALGEQRHVVGNWIAEFESRLDTQDPAQIARAREALLGYLDEFEGPTWF